MIIPSEGSSGMKKSVQRGSWLNAWFKLQDMGYKVISRIGQKSGSFFAYRYHPVSAHNETTTLARVFHELWSQQVIYETSGFGEGLSWVRIQV